MPNTSPRILVTGASGQLGRRVIRQLLDRARPAQIVAAVRNPEAAADLAALGVELRRADYEQPATLAAAFAGIDRLLLISSNAVGKRVPQHRAVIDAAKAAGIGRIAYTSILHADRSAIGLADEHRRTEALLQASGLPTALLRNGWYTENYAAAIPAARAHGALLGSAGDGRLSTATRDDYAAAAAAVLTAPDERFAGVYELAGDDAYTLAEFAAELSRQTGQTIVYRNLAEADYKAALAGAGLPEAVAGMLAQSDASAAGGALFDDSRTLSRLIGRPTTPLADAIAAALKKA